MLVELAFWWITTGFLLTKLLFLWTVMNSSVTHFLIMPFFLLFFDLIKSLIRSFSPPCHPPLSPNTQLQSHRVERFSWLITVQTECRASRLWLWPTQRQPPSPEPPSSSTHRPATASRSWFLVTRWWSRVSVCCFHITCINEVTCDAGDIWYFASTSFTFQCTQFILLYILIKVIDKTIFQSQSANKQIKHWFSK